MDVFRRRNDEEFVGLTPGLVPTDGAGEVRRGSRREYVGQTAVQFHPPRGVSAALAGAVVDGRVDPRDISAMMIDLSLRGHYRITRNEAGEWVFTRPDDLPGDDALSPAEGQLVDGIFGGNREVVLSQRKKELAQPLRRVGDALYDEVVERGWYPRRPDVRVFKRLRRVPRTATGSAVRVQTLGFREYLATAEAEQIRFEESADLFSRYLPFALVFGLAQRWAKVISEVVRAAELRDAGDAALWIASDPYAWYLLDAFGDLAGVGLESAAGVAELLGDADGLFDLGEVAGFAGDLFDGLGETVGELLGAIFDGF